MCLWSVCLSVVCGVSVWSVAVCLWSVCLSVVCGGSVWSVAPHLEPVGAEQVLSDDGDAGRVQLEVGSPPQRLAQSLLAAVDEQGGRVAFDGH